MIERTSYFSSVSAVDNDSFLIKIFISDSGKLSDKDYRITEESLLNI
jgi:hypothetical protein